MKVRSIKLVLATVGLIITTLAPSAAVAMPYSGLYVFGDSISDGGSAANLIGPDPGQVISSNLYIPSQPYASGTFSNGPVWASELTAMLKNAGQLPNSFSIAPAWKLDFTIPSAPAVALTGGTNFAVGGATTSGGNFSLSTQLGTFTSVFPVPSSGLYVIAGGGNNARNAFASLYTQPDFGVIGASLGSFSQTYANDVGAMVDALQAKGVPNANIIVWNTPNVGLAPAIKDFPLPIASGLNSSQLGSLVAGSLNGALNSRLASETGVKLLDTYALISGIAGNPPAFGLSNVTDACGRLSIGNCSTALFWDGIHSSAAAQNLLAQQVFALAVPEPSEIAMLLAGLLVVVGAARRRRIAA